MSGTTHKSFQDQYVERYRKAIRAWNTPGIADAAALIGMSQREYCDRYISRFGPIYSTTNATDTYNVGWSSNAYDVARRLESEATDDH